MDIFQAKSLSPSKSEQEANSPLQENALTPSPQPTREEIIADLLPPPAASAEEIMERLKRRAINALLISRNESKPQIVRDVAGAYLKVHKNHLNYLKAAFENQFIRQTIETGEPLFGETKLPFRFADLLVNVPAMWEFEFVQVPANVNDVMNCVSRYSWGKFMAVRPLAPTDPFSFIRVPIIHKESSPFHQRYSRRMALKRELGSTYRSLVGYARKWTKREFLEQFNTPPGQTIKSVDAKGKPYQRRRIIPNIEAWDLLNRTGYTPEEFWREVKKPNSVKPHRPQGELPFE